MIMFMVKLISDIYVGVGTYLIFEFFYLNILPCKTPTVKGCEQLIQK